MRLHVFFPLSSLLVLVLSAWLCKSDSNNNKKDTEDDKTSLAGLIEEHLQQAKNLQQEHARFKKMFAQLDESMANVPAEVKANVVGYDELESRFEGLSEKGEFRVQELSAGVKQLEALQAEWSAGRADSAIVDNALRDMKPMLAEHQGAVAELTEEFKAISEACAQVKAAIPKGGRGVVLFGGAPK